LRAAFGPALQRSPKPRTPLRRAAAGRAPAGSSR
jgi:hypothetical protein